MRITKIEEMTKSRSRIYIDDMFAFVLYKGELRLYHIREGEEIGQEDYDEIMTKVLPKRAKLRAMNLLKSKEYTVRQLHDKLRNGGYPEEIITLALEYVASYHYTDDLRYALTYLSQHESNRSRKRMEQDLMRRGIDKLTMEQAFVEWESRGGTQDEASMIHTLLEKKHFNPQNTDEKEIRRLYAFLLRKGFSGEQVRKALFSDYIETYT